MSLKDLKAKEVTRLLAKNMQKEKKGDLKEFWHFGQYLSLHDKKIYNYPDNPYVEEVPDFNKAGENTYKALEKNWLICVKSNSIISGSR